MASFGQVFHIDIMNGMKKWAQAHPSVELAVVDARDDSAKQTGQVENFLAQGMDAVIVQPVDASAAGPMNKAVLKAGKALVYVNRKPANLPKGVVFCGSNSIEFGMMNMEEIGKCMGRKGNVAILMGELSNEATIARTDGIKKVIKEKFPDIKVTREQAANWSRVEGQTVMENWLASGQEIDGVASNNDEMALGALQAIKAAGKLGKICVGGVDGTHDALESIQSESGGWQHLDTLPAGHQGELQVIHEMSHCLTHRPPSHVSRRFVKKQQMQWTLRGAHLLLQTRTEVLNNELEETFRRWYPQFRAAAACPPTFCRSRSRTKTGNPFENKNLILQLNNM